MIRRIIFLCEKNESLVFNFDIVALNKSFEFFEIRFIVDQHDFVELSAVAVFIAGGLFPGADRTADHRLMFFGIKTDELWRRRLFC